MNRIELKELLIYENIPSNSYSLDGGLLNDTLCIDKTKRGWIVYYTERGVKYEEMGFPSEEDACFYFYERIKRMLGRYNL